MSRDFVMNAWYCASWSEDLGTDLLALRILDIPVVLYRTETGEPAALRDICSHKFAPLHLGRRVGADRVQCPYHGLEFGPSGRCEHNPHGSGARPKALDVASYPIVDRHGVLWIWMGDAPADEAAIPDFSQLNAPDRRSVKGKSKILGNYTLVCDNLMDLSHAFYVHGITQRNYRNLDAEVVERGGEIFDYRLYRNVEAPPSARTGMVDPDIPVDVWTDVRWSPVSCFRTHTGVTPAGNDRDPALAIDQYGSHLLTPETRDATHYFFANSRNFRCDDIAIDRHFEEWQARALMTEDPTIIEAVAGTMPDVGKLGIRPALLPIDETGVRVTRTINKMRQLEAEEVTR